MCGFRFYAPRGGVTKKLKKNDSFVSVESSAPPDPAQAEVEDSVPAVIEDLVSDASSSPQCPVLSAAKGG